MAAESYITVDEIELLTGYQMSAAERERAGALIPIASAELRLEAARHGKTADSLISASDDYLSLVKDVLSTAIVRYLGTNAASPAMTQMSESALGYNIQGTFAVPGGGFYFTGGEKKRLGFRRQQYGVVDFTYGQT